MMTGIRQMLCVEKVGTPLNQLVEELDYGKVVLINTNHRQRANHALAWSTRCGQNIYRW